MSIYIYIYIYICTHILQIFLFFTICCVILTTGPFLHDSCSTKPPDILSRTHVNQAMCVKTSKDFTTHTMNVKIILCYKNLQ